MRCPKTALCLGFPIGLFIGNEETNSNVDVDEKLESSSGELFIEFDPLI